MRAIVHTGSADRQVRQAQEAVIASVTPALRDLAALPVWTEPTLLNGWAWYGGQWAKPGYARDAVGRVYVRGAIKSGTINRPCFVLPRTYRPGVWMQLGTMSNNAFGQVNISPTGEVYPGVGSPVLFSLDGITFIAEG